ncbi:PA2169 family four-helix-bundle protein [Paraburkholderia bonniea]|uniref:ferritin-like domain-containing protein n=1 Tax=Paraburkholderia bonniea TaxID=2152891 RepID=UPI0012928B4F|nr:PA2169 family four-helix-bundle protein [Paraburkholderia bonniea]WJF89134.1 PA2169 family four-helix-bundle protein [Paraburkholderia bonniea]WJF92450.1 PA2169 family four-helix-bundle protein [Paraburkholderia bonniea]
MSTNVVTVLNDLVETSKDGEKGFRKAAEEAHDAQLKTLFQGCAEDCMRGARELQDAVQHLGGKPESGGSISGALHRGWADVKAAVTGRSDHDILAECEKGEDVAKKHYREALEKDLPSDVRTLVDRQFQGVLQQHDRIRDLRDQYAAAGRR